MIYISFDIGIKNLAMCIVKEYDDKINIIDWRIISLKYTNEKIKGGINEIADRLYIELDNIIGELNDINISEIDYVLLENQPSNLNGVMKTIQLLIYSYFNLLKHWDNKVKVVNMIPATLKLQNHTYEPLSKRENIDRKKIKRKDLYNYNKKDGIELCSYYVKNNTILSEHYKTHKKKDDLADCLLQVISWIRKKGKKIEEINIEEETLFDISR